MADEQNTTVKTDVKTAKKELPEGGAVHKLSNGSCLGVLRLGIETELQSPPGLTFDQAMQWVWDEFNSRGN